MNFVLAIMFGIIRIIQNFSEATTFLKLQKEYIVYKATTERRTKFCPMGCHNRILINLCQGSDTIWLILRSFFHLLENSFIPLLCLPSLTRMKSQFYIEPKGSHLARI